MKLKLDAVSQESVQVIWNIISFLRETITYFGGWSYGANDNDSLHIYILLISIISHFSLDKTLI